MSSYVTFPWNMRTCFTNSADDTTPYVVASNTAEVIENLTIISQKIFI